LRGESDYRRFEGRLAKIVTAEPVEGQSSFAGRLAGVEAGAVQLTEGRRTHRIPLALIKRARLDVEF
jgi:ribosome maturation factor RimP